MAKRHTPQPRMTPDEQAAELAKITAEMHEAQEQAWDANRRLSDLEQRYHEVRMHAMRDRLEEHVGHYVKLTSTDLGIHPTRRLQPRAGDIGRLVKLNRTHAVVDFGDNLYTWHIPFASLGMVNDPLRGMGDAPLEEHVKPFVDRDREIMEWGAAIEEDMDRRHRHEDNAGDEEEGNEDEDEDDEDDE